MPTCDNDLNKLLTGSIQNSRYYQVPGAAPPSPPQLLADSGDYGFSVIQYGDFSRMGQLVAAVNRYQTGIQTRNDQRVIAQAADIHYEFTSTLKFLEQCGTLDVPDITLRTWSEQPEYQNTVDIVGVNSSNRITHHGYLRTQKQNITMWQCYGFDRSSGSPAKIVESRWYVVKTLLEHSVKAQDGVMA